MKERRTLFLRIETEVEDRLADPFALPSICARFNAGSFDREIEAVLERASAAAAAPALPVKRIHASWAKPK